MLTGVSGQAGVAPGEQRRARRGRARRAGWALALAAGGAVLFTLYLSESRTAMVNSDGAANVLQGLALDHGSLLLRGWWTSDVSFYSTELPEYALVTAIRGVAPDVVHLCGALTYTLTVALTVLLARGRASGRAHDLAPGWARAGIAAGIVLVPSLLGGTQVFLENPDHAGTAVPVLALLLLLDLVEPPGGTDSQHGGPRPPIPPGPRTPRGEPDEKGRISGPRKVRYIAAAAGLLLAVTQLGDPLSLLTATIPLAGACVVGLVTAAAHGRPRSRPDGLLLAAAVSSVVLAWVAGVTIRALGGFHTRPFPDALLVPLGQWPAHARLLWQSLVLLFGARPPGVTHHPTVIARPGWLLLMADLHVIGLVLALAGLAGGIAVVASGRADRVGQMLVAAIGLMLAAGVFSPVLHSLAYAHEIAMVVPLAAALAGRTLPPLARRLAPSRPAARGWPARLAAVALAGWLGAGVAELGYAAARPASPPPLRAVADWLVAHHQREGLAGYWQADITTVDSGGRVQVAPVTGQGATTDRWESSAAWYRPSDARATFVIAAGPGPLATTGALTPATVRARFGPPAAQYQVGGAVILIYRYNLLNRLRHRAFPGSS